MAQAMLWKQKVIKLFRKVDVPLGDYDDCHCGGAFQGIIGGFLRQFGPIVPISDSNRQVSAAVCGEQTTPVPVVCAYEAL